MNKKKVMLYGVIISIILLISALLPYFKVTVIDSNGTIISDGNFINFINSIFSLIPLIFIIIILILTIRNFKIVKNNLTKNTSNPFWLIVIMLFISMGIFGMEFSYEYMAWASDESGTNLLRSISIGYYLFRVALLGELIYVFLVFKLFFYEKKLKVYFNKWLNIVKIFLIILTILSVGSLAKNHIPKFISFVKTINISKNQNNLMVNPVIINNSFELDIPNNYIVIGKDVTYEYFYDNYKEYIGKKVLMFGEKWINQCKSYKFNEKNLNRTFLEVTDNITVYSIYYSDNNFEHSNEFIDSKKTKYGYFLGTIKSIDFNETDLEASINVYIEPEKIYFENFYYDTLNNYDGNIYYSDSGESIKIEKKITRLSYELSGLSEFNYLEEDLAVDLATGDLIYNGYNIFYMNESSWHGDKMRATLEFYDNKIIMKGYTIYLSNKDKIIKNNDIKVFYK